MSDQDLLQALAVASDNARKAFEEACGSEPLSLNGISFWLNTRFRPATLSNRQQWESEAIAVEVTEAGGVVSKLPGSCQLLVNNEVVVTVVVGRSPRYERPQNQWRFGYRSRRRPDVLVVARVDPAGRVVDYYILPYLFLARGTWITVSGKNYERLDSFRTETLAPLTEILARLRPECLR
jgi:hypothetical protein